MHILIRISLILKAGVAKNPVLELMNGVQKTILVRGPTSLASLNNVHVVLSV